MIAHKTIYIKNIYYMLSYAFKVLNQKEYKKIEAENFENTVELLSEILIIGVSHQIKQGLVKDYRDVSETTSSVRGKINITESINSQTFIKKQLNCTYDEFSENCYLNQIIKSTMKLLLNEDISRERKKKLKNLLMYFRDVDLIDVKTIKWKLRFDRNNQMYKLLVNICYLTINGLLLSEKTGNVKIIDFEDNVMHSLYERFLLNYFKKEHPEIHTYAPQIDWQVDEGIDSLPPKMLTDVVLEYENKILIIDAKFYSQNTVEKNEKNIHRERNLYQIFAYVKNKDLELKGKDYEVSGMLLYARTNQIIQPDSDYLIDGNMISVKNINLYQDFIFIKEQLDNIVCDYLL